MVFQVLVHIECIQFLGVETGEEHTHNQKQVYRFHPGLALLHPLVDIVVVSAKVIRGECGTEVSIVIVHNRLELIGLHFISLKALIHSGLGIILAGIRCVGKDGRNLDIRLKALENLVVFQEHRD